MALWIGLHCTVPIQEEVLAGSRLVYYVTLVMGWKDTIFGR
jgi:hypothetical protein